MFKLGSSLHDCYSYVPILKSKCWGLNNRLKKFELKKVFKKDIHCDFIDFSELLAKCVVYSHYMAQEFDSRTLL